MDYLFQYPVRVHESNRENIELGAEKHALKGRCVSGVVAWEGITSGKCSKENKKDKQQFKNSIPGVSEREGVRPSVGLWVCNPSA